MPLSLDAISPGTYFTISSLRNPALRLLDDALRPGTPLQAVTVEAPFIYARRPLHPNPGLYVIDSRDFHLTSMSRRSISRLHKALPPPANQLRKKVLPTPADHTAQSHGLTGAILRPGDTVRIEFTDAPVTDTLHPIDIPNPFDHDDPDNLVTPDE